MIHQPVLLQEVIDGLEPETGESFLDATINRGGHSLAIAPFLGPGGLIIGVDLDAIALREAEINLANCSPQIKLAQGNFRSLDSILAGLKIETIDLALLDLGISSNQLEVSERGFSFQRDEPLLMTLADASSLSPDSLTARRVVNEWPEEDLADLIFRYGEERFSRKIAKAIREARQDQPIETTTQLVEVIKSAVPEWYTHRRLHFATKTFQALRLAVNDELGALEEGLGAIWRHLAPNGRLAVISFHSLEARLVKNFFKARKLASEGVILTKHAIKPSRDEVLSNPRARSAQLRIIKKI